MIAPATANVIAKLAHGIADDMLTTTVLACQCPKIVFPAMNTRMYEAAVTQDNMETLRRYGYLVAETAEGRLACGDVGAGKTAGAGRDSRLCASGYRIRKGYGRPAPSCDGRADAGSCRSGPLSHEPLHRFHGVCDCACGSAPRALVTLVSGPTALEKPRFAETIDIVSAADMFREVTSRQPEHDIIIKAAAVADYRPAQVFEDKVKKSDGEMSIPLARTQDILQYLGEHRREGQFLCGFSMETRDMLENSRKKLEKKKVDMIAANNLKVPGAGFGTATNVITIITKHGEEELPLLSKEEAADRLLTAILRERGAQ